MISERPPAEEADAKPGMPPGRYFGEEMIPLRTAVAAEIAACASGISREGVQVSQLPTA